MVSDPDNPQRPQPVNIFWRRLERAGGSEGLHPGKEGGVSLAELSRSYDSFRLPFLHPFQDGFVVVAISTKARASLYLRFFCVGFLGHFDETWFLCSGMNFRFIMRQSASPRGYDEVGLRWILSHLGVGRAWTKLARFVLSFYQEICGQWNLTDL